MPNLIDIAQRFAEEPTLALLHEERCLPERDLGATCSRCADACPVDAIELAGNVLASGTIGYGSVEKAGSTGPRIDEEACVRCGRCIVACPTGALLAAPPFDDDTLLEEAARVAEAAAATAAGTFAPATAAPVATHAAPTLASTPSPAPRESFAEQENPTAAQREGSQESPHPSSTCGFACTRATQAARIDGERVAVLPCLAWVDEALLVHAAYAGASRVVLLAAPCGTCEHARAVEALPHIAAEAQRILDTWNIPCEVVYAEQGAEGLAAPLDTDAAGELSRRNLFTQARAAVAEAATEAAKTQLDAFVGVRTEDIAREVEPDRRRWQLLDDLHAFSLPADDTIVPRALAPRVDIAVDSCSGCALCAEFCPTNALRKVGKGAGGTTLLEFDAALCRDCSVCTDTCRYGAITCEETLTVGELFGLEPHTLVVPKRRVLPTRR